MVSGLEADVQGSDRVVQELEVRLVDGAAVRGGGGVPYLAVEIGGDAALVLAAEVVDPPDDQIVTVVDGQLGLLRHALILP